MLINLSSATENKILGSPSLGMVPELLNILRSTTLIDLKNKICGCLWNLSVATENRKYMASAPLGIWMSYLASRFEPVSRTSLEDEAEAKSTEDLYKSCVIVQNLAGEPANHELMIDPKFDLMTTLASVILNKTGDIRLKKRSVLSLTCPSARTRRVP